jgi:hypothetical protein
MKCSGREHAKRFGDLLWRDVPRFGRGPSNQQICENGTRRDRCNAALSLEARGREASLLEPDRQPQDIATDGVRDFDARSGVWEIARVVWIAKMLEHSIVNHSNEYRAKINEVAIPYARFLKTPANPSLFSFESH